MRWLINYIRQMFCAHMFDERTEYPVINKHFIEGREEPLINDRIRMSMICKKCGYHRSFWRV